MSRIRIKPTADSNDGGAFSPNNRPPARLLSPEWAKAFKELDDTVQRITAARMELSDATDQATRLAAQTADRRNSAEAARRGDTTGSTALSDALDARERQARADIEALKGATQLIHTDLADLRTKAQEGIATLTKTEAGARERLAKALTTATTEAQAVAEAIALREWITDHAPFDPSVSLDVLDIWAPAHRVVDEATARIPVTLDAITTAINDL